MAEPPGPETVLAAGEGSADHVPTQRTILYARKGGAGHSHARSSARKPLPVPRWFDLPVLLPEPHAVAARIQCNMLNRVVLDHRGASTLAPREKPAPPKMSRLAPASPHAKHAGTTPPLFSSTREAEEQKARRMSAEVLRRTAKRRQSTRVRKLDELKVGDRKNRSRLREKLWKDLDRFGLWPMPGPNDDTEQSVEDTVDSILAQWQEHATETMLASADDELYPSTTGFGFGEEEDGSPTVGSRRKSSAFITDIPEDGSAPMEPEEDGKSQPSRRRSSIRTTSGGGDAAPEGDDNADAHEGDDNESEQDEDGDQTPSFFGSQRNLQVNITTPGMKRRRRLKELHRFVGTQLQKRLFKSWDTIEVAFTGSGDMTVAQIVKFLQNSDVQLGTADAAKVQAILEQHVTNREQPEDDYGFAKSQHQEGAQQSNQRPLKPKQALLSYEGFRQLFRPADSQEASRWKREFDREKFRHKQEKEIYNRELAALEEKVKQRLATSAKQMVEILVNFKCDPAAIPWDNDEQRLLLRAQFLEVIFRKPQRRRILQIENALANSGRATSPGAQNASTIPEKLSVKPILSALLQKYSRNGHFESIEVPVAAYLYHDIAVDGIKKSIQRYWAKFEIDQWPERQMIFRFRMKKQVFHDWRKFTSHAKIMRQYVLRKFVAWKYLTRKLHEYYAFYRTCFWPFYIWKRHLQKMIIARGKTIFLTNVLRTYIQLQNFRAMKKRYRLKQWRKRQVARVRKKKARQVITLCWEAWKERFESSLIIRRVWRGHGHVLQQLHKFYMVRVTFYVLRYYSILKKDLERRRFKSLLALFSTNARGKPQHQTQRQQLRKKQTNNSQRSSSWYSNGAVNASLSLHGAPSAPYLTAPKATAETMGGTHVQIDLPTSDLSDDDHDASIHTLVEEDIPKAQLHNKASPGEPADAGASLSLTRIMETEMGKKIKRKSRLYNVCLGLYLKYRERDRSHMIGNVVAFRRFGRIFLKNLCAAVRHGRKNRFASDLGAFRVLHLRFRQWMIGTIYKLPPTAQQDEYELGADAADEQEGSNDVVVLHWKHDREWRLQGIENNPIQALQLREDLLTVMANDSVRKETIRGRELLLNKKQHNEDAFLRKEAGATLKIKAAQMQQVQQMMRRRAHRLHDVLDHVYDDLQRQQMQQQLKSSFRSLRVIAMLKYTKVLCHRAQLRNWLRLCHRFIYWEKHMSQFYLRKLKYHTFQTLLRHVVWKWKFQSSGLSVKLQRSQQLMWKYEHFMEKHGVLDGSSDALYLASTKYSPANTFNGVFLRWVQFTQTSRARRKMIQLSRRKRELWMVHSVFHALRTRVKVKYTYQLRCSRQPFLVRQSLVDLDTYHCKIIALGARLPTTLLRTQLGQTRLLLQQIAMGSPTLKRLFQRHEKEVRERLRLEKRLMFVAYTDRRVHNYAERSSSLFGATVGRPFIYEKAPPYGSISEVAIICSGKKVDGICLTVKTNASVSFEGALHGNPFGTREVFAIPKGDRLVSIEGFASQSIYGLRFGTSSGRLSKWFGHCEKGTKFELHSDFAGKHEEIVGVFGHADSTTINSLGVVMRHTTLKNPFEGLWLQGDHQIHQQQQQQQSGQPSPPAPQRSGGEELALCDRQFAYFLQVRTCEVLLVMQRAHLFALRVHRMDTTLSPALGSLRVIMSLARWLFNSLAHGLVHCTDREEEGERILQGGLAKHAAGEKMTDEGVNAMQVVDSFRDAEGQLDAATLGVKKIMELREMMAHAQEQLALGRDLMEKGQSEIAQSQRILPHLPMTKRMVSAIRKMYKVVQTKDYIDQMNPELRAILMLKKDAAPTEDGKGATTPIG